MSVFALETLVALIVQPSLAYHIVILVRIHYQVRLSLFKVRLKSIWLMWNSFTLTEMSLCDPKRRNQTTITNNLFSIPEVSKGLEILKGNFWHSCREICGWHDHIFSVCHIRLLDLTVETLLFIPLCSPLAAQHSTVSVGVSQLCQREEHMDSEDKWLFKANDCIPFCKGKSAPPAR